MAKLTDLAGRIDKNSYFYNHFVDEKKIEAINDKKVNSQFCKYSMLLMAAPFGTAFPMSLAFNTSVEILDRTYLLFELNLFAFLLYYFIRFVLVFNLCGIFKKKRMTPLFPFLFLLYPLLILSYALVRHFLPFANENYYLPLHPFEIFVLSTPLFFAYTIFCCHAYRVCICKCPLKSSLEINSLHR